MIEFDADRHEYRVNGQRVPSVTQILAHTLPDPYAHVDERTLEIARDRGIAVDEAIQWAIRGQRRDEEPDIAPYVDSYLQWVKMTGWRTITVQPRLYDSTLGVCGTADEVGWLNGRVTVIDWKCTAQRQQKHAYQVAAYCDMWNQNNPQLRTTQGRVLLMRKNGECARAESVDVQTVVPQWMRLVLEYKAALRTVPLGGGAAVSIGDRVGLFLGLVVVAVMLKWQGRI